MQGFVAQTGNACHLVITQQHRGSKNSYQMALRHASKILGTQSYSLDERKIPMDFMSFIIR